MPRPHTKGRYALYRSEGDTVEVRHLAYLARQRASIARETAVLKGAELAISNANSERDRVRLLARTREAENAGRAAALAEQRADAARRDALAAEQQAAAAQEQARQSQNDALASRQQLRDARDSNGAACCRVARHQSDSNRSWHGHHVGRRALRHRQRQATFRVRLRVVARLAVFMREHPDRTLAIEGFTDSVGNFGRQRGIVAPPRRGGARSIGGRRN